MTNANLETLVTTMRRLGIKRLAIDIADHAHADASKPESVELAPAKAPEPPRVVREMDAMEADMVEAREAKRRLAERQAEEDSILYAASISY